MQNIRKLSIIAATFLLAAATGHVMQTVQGIQTVSVAASKQAEAVAQMRVTGLTISSTAALPALPMRPITADLAQPSLVPPVEPAVAGFDVSDCAPARLNLAVQSGALIAVALSAPCAARGTATLHLGALEFGAPLDASGNWSGLVPALGFENRLEARLPGNVRLAAQVTVPALASLNRMVLLWNGSAPVHLNAYEYGAKYGSAGHVYAGMPRTPDTPLGGYMMSYGGTGPGRHFEIYTAPTDMRNIRFDLEAPVTASSCGRYLRASVVQVHAGKTLSPLPVTLSMPSCDQLDGSVTFDLPEDLLARAASN